MDIHERREWLWDRDQSLRRSNEPVQELWHFVSLVDQLSHNPMQGRLCEAHLFRGQRGTWPLLPKIARADLIEYSSELEASMLLELKRLSPLVMSDMQRPSNDLQWLSLAQHYGMPTRLLDWTDNALAALWFAVQGAGRLGDKEARSVWVLSLDDHDIIEPSAINLFKYPFNVERTRVVCPEHFDQRIRSQSGWFTLHHHHRERGFMPLEEEDDYRQKTAEHLGKLGRIDIAPGFVAPLRRQLDRVGVNAASIFPDLAGLCQRIADRACRDFIPRPRPADTSGRRTQERGGETP